MRKRKYSHDIYLTGCLDAAACRMCNSACQFAAHFHLQKRKSGTRFQSRKRHLLFSNHGFVFCMFIIYCLVCFTCFRAHMILLMCTRACRLFFSIHQFSFSDLGLLTSLSQPLAVSMLPMFLSFIYVTKNLGRDSRHWAEF